MPELCLGEFDNGRTYNSHEDLLQGERKALREAIVFRHALLERNVQRIGHGAHQERFMLDLMELDETPQPSMGGTLHACQKLVSRASIHPERRNTQE